MRLYLLTDNEDTAVGMRLAGIEGTVITGSESFKNSLEKISANDEIGILLINETLAKANVDIIDTFRKEHSVPVIVEIPDRNSTGTGNSISDYVRKAIGINV